VLSGVPSLTVSIAAKRLTASLTSDTENPLSTVYRAVSKGHQTLRVAVRTLVWVQRESRV
jgi:hypothetical protein